MTLSTNEIHNHRRYCLLKGRIHEAREEGGIAFAWYGKQIEAAGTALPASIPYQTELAAGRYTTIEDLDGADEAELVDFGLKQKQAAEVLKALSLL